VASRRARLAILEDALQDLDTLAEGGEFGGGETGEPGPQGLDPSGSSAPKRPGTGRRRANAHGPRIVGIGLAQHESIPRQSVYQPRHRRRLDLLDARELADPPRAGEHQDRQNGEARGRDAQRLILHAQATQEMDRGRVEPVGDPAHLSRRGSPP